MILLLSKDFVILIITCREARLFFEINAENTLRKIIRGYYELFSRCLTRAFFYNAKRIRNETHKLEINEKQTRRKPGSL